MLSAQWVIGYLCIAALVTGGCVVLAAWSRKSQTSAPAVAVPALAAGALWPLVLAGLGQWLLVHGLGEALRRKPVHTDAASGYGRSPADPVSRPKVGAA
jgi:hypothetical protein